ncbi:MAG: polysaccharide biosynthesis tyrosine autokinase [Gammaproteobacteria bacterium]|nr:polysaccharide biosynthesis tyrosine autokinase [Gammaproteobacteria bacterium]
MELLEYWHLFRRWLWLILLAAMVAAGAAYAFSIYQTPIYQASTRLEVSPSGDSSPLVSYADVLVNERLTSTYAHKLTARPVLIKAFESVVEDAEKHMGLADISVQPLRDTQLIDLQVQHPSPFVAAAIANNLPKVFITFNSVQQSERFRESKWSLETELASINEEIMQVEEGIQALNGVIDLESENRRILLGNRLAQYRSSYSFILAQLEEIRLAEASGLDTITVIEEALVPISPVRPRVLLNTLLAGIVGAMLGLGAAFLIEYLDDTVKTPDDVGRSTGLNTLGVVAKDRRRRDRERSIVTLIDPRSSNAEAYRALRTGIQFSGVDAPIRKLLITSTGPKDGKSVTAANLAVVMAQAGNRVVLVDADLRKPRQHIIWDLPNTVGLTGALLLEKILEDISYLLSPTSVEDLWVITSGQVPPNPSELLGSHKMQALTDRILQDHDIVVFDSPPALAVTDPIVLGQAMDGVLVVVSAGENREQALVQTVMELQKVNANVLGVVLNKYKERSSSGYYYHYYNRYYDDSDEGRGGAHSQIYGQQEQDAKLT